MAQPYATKEFEEFWKKYPRKVGKLAAMKAYAKARTQATAAEIDAGVARYVAGKPQYADFCHPATFLNAGRWMDEYDTPPPRNATARGGWRPAQFIDDGPPKASELDWFKECREIHGGACNGSKSRHILQKQIDAQKAKDRAL